MRTPETRSRPHRLPLALNHGIFCPVGRATNAWSPRVYPIQSVPCRTQCVDRVPIQALGGTGDTAVSGQVTALSLDPALLLRPALEPAAIARAVNADNAAAAATRLAFIGRSVCRPGRRLGQIRSARAPLHRFPYGGSVALAAIEGPRDGLAGVERGHRRLHRRPRRSRSTAAPSAACARAGPRSRVAGRARRRRSPRARATSPPRGRDAEPRQRRSDDCDATQPQLSSASPGRASLAST